MRLLFGLITAGIMTIIFSIFYLLSIPFDRKNRSFSFVMYWWSRSVFAATGIEVKSIGLDKIDLSKPYVYVSNHASLFDITAVVVGVNRYVRFLAKKEITRIPIFGWATARAHIMVDRKGGPDSLRILEKAAARIALGDSVIVFAEGTRTMDGNLQPFKRGAFSLAIQAGVPVVPLTILGSYNIMQKGSFNLRKGAITIIVDPPVDTAGYHDKQGAVALMNRVHDIIEKNYVKDGKAQSLPTGVVYRTGRQAGA